MRNIGGDPSKEGVSTIEGRRRFRENFDNIDFSGCNQDNRPGSYFWIPSLQEWVHEDDLTPDMQVEKSSKCRKMDANNLKSESMGCAPQQVEEFNKNLVMSGISGAKYDFKGMLHMRDRQTKLKVMKARQLHDRDEVRG